MTDLCFSVWRELRRKPARTLLTVCSLAVGVGMLTLLCAVSAAGSRAADEELRAMGLDGFSVTAAERPLDTAALEAVAALPDVTVAAPLTVVSTAAVLGDEPETVLLCGVDEHAADAVAIDLTAGRMPTARDVLDEALYCTVEETAATAAFGNRSPLGETVTVWIDGGEFAFTVAGTARAKSSLLKNLTGNLPPLLLVPASTLAALSGSDTVDRLAVRSPLPVEELQTRIRTVLADYGNVDIDTLAVQKDRLSRLTALLSCLLTLAGGAALVVSGGNLLTTGLSTVAERVPEIGLKKALGATRSRILAEFLLSAALQSAFGGAAGLLLGGTAAAIGLRCFGVPFAPSVWRGICIFLATVAFGTLCGAIPAEKAARLSPAEAFCRA